MVEGVVPTKSSSTKMLAPGGGELTSTVDVTADEEVSLGEGCPLFIGLIVIRAQPFRSFAATARLSFAATSSLSFSLCLICSIAPLSSEAEAELKSVLL